MTDVMWVYIFSGHGNGQFKKLTQMFWKHISLLTAEKKIFQSEGRKKHSLMAFYFFTQTDLWGKNGICPRLSQV